MTDREGLQLRELSERLGHYDPAFTLSVYTHVLEDATGGAMTLAQLTAQKPQEEAPAPKATEISAAEGGTVN
ncbi:MAG: hypothetical protein ACC742_13390 [Thermoanaerobaculales bacterium]